ncbi:hypothetical protein EYR40_000971 [Pleurotus pulmonarius]|nr:hypothetical protein EYR38_004216 [Pleurotus pulmonarius]KAF4608625.1 hypothetical protein EYR40_000971 [Pleurotus pulmonarius]
MDTNILPIPRLRLSRNPHYTHSDPVAGPSRLPESAATHLSGIEEHEDSDGSTPKLMSKLLSNSKDASADTPAARLRALISSASAKFPQSTPPPPPKSPSLLDSDFETPLAVGRDKSSIADVKQIFSFALREPGDTPQKTRTRRNSIDGSEVDGSPVKSRDKGKRKSLSDEEIDNVSLRSSLATTTFNTLREKLENSRSQLKNMPLSKILDLDNDSQDTASLLRELNQATPPIATSTPQRSMQMPLFSSQSSNLLGHDSEMNRMMEAIEDSVPFPTEERSETPVDLTARRHSVPISPMHKGSPHSTSRRVSDNDKLREREREWNKPQPPRPLTPDLKHRHSHGSFSSRSNSPMLSPGWSPVRRTLSRKSSIASIQSQDDDFSSRASSVMSQADYRERVSLEEQERDIEREREWNKPHHRSSSSMDVHSPSRPRTQSAGGLLRSTSSLSFHSPDRQNKRHSISSASSNESHNRSAEDLGGEDPVHLRERNWNAPRPRWSHSRTLSLTSRRSLSPLPPDGGTPPGSPTTRQKELFAERPRTPAGNAPIPASHSPLAASLRGSNRPVSPLPSIRKGASIPPSSPSRSTVRNRENHVTSTPQGTPGRSSPLPQRPSSRAHAGRAGSPDPRSSTRAPGLSSRIPVRASKQSVPASPTPAVSRRSPSPERLPAQTLDKSSQLRVAASNHSPESSASHEATPSMRNLTLPDEGTAKNSPSGPTTIQELSPPPTPSSEEPNAEPLQSSVLSTPPRRSSFSASRIEFQTPSPPKGLPDLPGPPPSSEDDTGTAATFARIQPQSGPNFSMMKTPKPPGGWADTPGPQRPAPLQRTTSLEQPPPGQDGLGLATPGPSLSRASTMPLQTPAPPGGWMATPAPRKSILKVRFDPQPNALTASSQDETSAPESQNGHPAGSPPTPPAEADEQVSKAKDQADVSRRGSEASKGLRRLPSIRMLDAYGRETKPGGHDEARVKREDGANTSAINILDAMGRAIEDPGDLSVMSTDESTILDHNEALSRVRSGLNALAHDMSDIDRSNDQIALDQTRLKELDTMSQAARETREKLAQTLCMARSSQEELRNKIAPLRASMRRSRSQLFTHDVSPSRGAWHGWLFWAMVVAQVVLVLAMYRMSVNRAKDIFMTTYYDPFEPDLHLYAVRPEAYDLSSSSSSSSSLSSLSSSSASPRTWSILAIKDFVYARGLGAALADVWGVCAEGLAVWQRRTWVLWGEDVPRKWPPM